ncbi:hypothetical protein UF75_4766 [Desulfosporosinus sp. I2]|nr:hypothetical protein UF75_4766 [Desulfosporosinus sp. I2]
MGSKGDGIASRGIFAVSVRFFDVFLHHSPQRGADINQLQ